MASAAGLEYNKISYGRDRSTGRCQGACGQSRCPQLYRQVSRRWPQKAQPANVEHEPSGAVHDRHAMPVHKSGTNTFRGGFFTVYSPPIKPQSSAGSLPRTSEETIRHTGRQLLGSAVTKCPVHLHVFGRSRGRGSFSRPQPLARLSAACCCSCSPMATCCCSGSHHIAEPARTAALFTITCPPPREAVPAATLYSCNAGSRWCKDSSSSTGYIVSKCPSVQDIPAGRERLRVSGEYTRENAANAANAVAGK